MTKPELTCIWVAAVTLNYCFMAAFNKLQPWEQGAGFIGAVCLLAVAANGTYLRLFPPR